MRWSFSQTGFKENIRLQDETCTPDELSIFFVIYDHDEGLRNRGEPPFLSNSKRELIERLIVEGKTPSRLQYELAKQMGGILRNTDGQTTH